MRRKDFKSSGDILEWLCGKDLWIYSWFEYEGTYVYVRVFDKAGEPVAPTDNWNGVLYGCQYYLAPESGLNDLYDLGVSHEDWVDATAWDFTDSVLEETYTNKEFPEIYNALVDEYWPDKGASNTGYIDMEHY